MAALSPTFQCTWLTGFCPDCSLGFWSYFDGMRLVVFNLDWQEVFVLQSAELSPVQSILQCYPQCISERLRGPYRF